MWNVGTNKNKLVLFKMFNRIADNSLTRTPRDPGKLAFFVKMKFAGKIRLPDFPDKEYIFRRNDCGNRFHIAAIL